ncbi:MAG: hypothetical protein RR922_00825 [Clostridia bacterium]
MKKIVKVIPIVIIIMMMCTAVLAADTNPKDTVNGFFGTAFSWFNQGKTDQGSAEGLKTAIEPIVEMAKYVLEIVGNAIFLIASIILGVKYIYSASDAKANIKESFLTLMVGALFFYSASTITSFATGAIEGIFVSSAPTIESITGSAFKTVAVVAQVAAFAGVVALGIRYMFASADAKADIKKSMFPLVIGLVLVFATASFLTFATGAMESLFG